MEKESHGTTQGYFLVLGLSETASRSISAIRTHYWRLTGNITFRLLPAQVPLAWSLSQFPDFAKMHIPTPPKPTKFTRLVASDTSLYLGTGDPAWSLYLSSLRQYLTGIVKDGSSGEDILFPIPLVDGPYIGNAPQTAVDSPQELITEVDNRDWRLQQYAVQWEKENGTIIHLKYTLLSDIHLI